MIQSTWYFLLVVGHVALVGGVIVSESRRLRSWPAPLLTLGAGIVLGVAALYASEIEVVTEQGITTTSEPFVGIYALGLSIAGFILGLLMTLNWFGENV